MAFGLENSADIFRPGLSTGLNTVRSAEQRTIGAESFSMMRTLLDNQDTSLVTDMLGTNPVSAPVVQKSVQSMGVVNSSAGQTQANAQAAVGTKAELSAHIENTKQSIQTAQTGVRAQLDQAFDNAAGADGLVRDDMGNGYNRGQVQGAFGGAAEGMSDGAEFGALIAGAKIGGGKAMAMADTAAEMMSAAGIGQGKLPVKLQNRISEELAKIQYHDSNTSPSMKGRIEKAWAASEEQKASAVSGNDQPSALNKLYDEMLQPAENFPEMQAMRNLQSDLDAVIEQHVEAEPDVDQALSLKNATGFDVADIDDAHEFTERAHMASYAICQAKDCAIPVQEAFKPNGLEELVKKLEKAEDMMPMLQNEPPKNAVGSFAPV